MRIICSSSVANFQDRLLKYWHLKDNITLFFGLYHNGDYLKFLLQRGKKTIFWCGGDILQLKNWIKPFLKKAEHWCENEIEQQKLKEMGFKAQIGLSFLDNINNYPISFKPKNPEIFLSMRFGREKEYGLNVVYKIASYLPKITFHIYGTKLENRKNIIFHGDVPEEQFNQEIRNYQGSLRLNRFEGFSEVIAKSWLLGLYPISAIKYPYVWHANTLRDIINFLKRLKQTEKPNILGREYCLKKINKFPFLKC